eukprot:jgi/Chlat1/1441/Chrsp12S02000
MALGAAMADQGMGLVEHATPASPAEGGGEQQKSAQLKSYVISALCSRAQGKTELYDCLVADMVARPHDLELLDVLAQCVSYINPVAHESLLAQVFAINLWNSPDQAGRAWMRLIENLMSFRQSLQSTCLQSLLGHFRSPTAWVPRSDTRLTPDELAAALSEEKARLEAKRPFVLEEIHKQLQRVLARFPLSAMNMLDYIVQAMPYRALPKQEHVAFLASAFRLAESRPASAMRERLLSAVVDVMLQIDVEIQWEVVNPSLPAEDEDEDEEEEVDIDDEDFAEGIVDDESQDDNPVVPSTQHTAPKEDRGPQAPDAVNDEISKLDTMMCMTLEHLKRLQGAGQASQVYQEMLRVFESSFLSTHRSKAAQFLGFVIFAEAGQQGHEAFLEQLLQTTVVAAVTYLASFLARCKVVHQGLVTQALVRLVQWCHEYSTQSTSSEPYVPPARGMADAARHQVFYAAVQAVLYVLCYRAHELMRVTDAAALLRSLPLPAILEHRLNPLMVCLPPVVQQFCDRAGKLGLIDCHALVEANARSLLSMESKGTVQYRLKTFFPFDPCLLPEFSKYVQPLYLTWQDVQFTDDEAQLLRAVYAVPVAALASARVQPAAQVVTVSPGSKQSGAALNAPRNTASGVSSSYEASTEQRSRGSVRTTASTRPKASELPDDATRELTKQRVSQVSTPQPAEQLPIAFRAASSRMQLAQSASKTQMSRPAPLTVNEAVSSRQQPDVDMATSPASALSAPDVFDVNSDEESDDDMHDALVSAPQALHSWRLTINDINPAVLFNPPKSQPWRRNRPFDPYSTDDAIAGLEHMSFSPSLDGPLGALPPLPPLPPPLPASYFAPKPQRRIKNTEKK